MISDRQVIAEVVQRCLMDAHDRGLITQNNSSEWVAMSDLYAFTLGDVLGVFVHKLGVGDGVWFQLKSGKIVDWLGRDEDNASCLNYR